MRNVLAIVAVMLLVSFAIDVGGFASRMSVEWQLFNPRLSEPDVSTSLGSDLVPLVSPNVTLSEASGQSLRGYIRSYGMLSTLRLDITFKGKVAHVLTTNGTEELLTWGSSNCTAKPGGDISCRLLMRISNAKDASFIVAPSEGDLIIKSARLETAQVKRATILSGNLIYAVFLGLIFLGPIIVFSRRVPHLEMGILAGLSIGWMLFLSVQVFLAVAVFISCVYITLRWMIERRERSRPLLLTCFLLLIAVLIFVKLGLPYFGYVFANPGAMWFALPLGFSYFIIKIVDVMISVYSKRIKELRASEFLVFMIFPATLAAGPILTLEQFRTASIVNYGVVDWTAGLGRFLLGMVKKVVADSFVYPVVIAATSQFILTPESVPSVQVCFFLILTTLYVYLDFSAYSDMAIGAGRAMGWRIPENFDLPLLRQGMHQFWRTWHMTLSNWVFRRVFVTALMSSRSQGLATFMSMLTIGFWHQIGFAWTCWAAHHSVMLSLQDALFRRLDRVFESLRCRLTIFAGRVTRVGLGTCLVWTWVSLGHSFTQFSDRHLYFLAYLRGLEGAGVLALGFAFIIGLLWVSDWFGCACMKARTMQRGRS